MLMPQSLCMKCKNAEATVRITKIIKGEVHEIRLCQECASKLTPFQKPAGLTKLLASLLQSEKGAKTAATPTKVCDRCGVSLENYRSTLFLGCKECYTAFEEELKKDLRKYHGSTSHVGRIPPKYARAAEKSSSIGELRKQMEKAIEIEDFEIAAKLRDQIRELEKAHEHEEE